MKLNMSKFKKVNGDKDHTIMQHEDGHMMKIAHKALSPKMRQEMSKLPIHEAYAQGGDVKDTKSEPSIDKDKLKSFQDNSIFNSQGKKKQASYAQGGKVDKLEIEELKNPEPKDHLDYEPIKEEKKSKKKLDYEPAEKLDYEAMAEGGETSLPIQTNPAEMQIPPQFQNPSVAPTEVPQPTQIPQAAQTPQAQPLQQPTQNVEQPPSLMGGYQKEVAGKQEEAQAIGQQGDQQAKALAQQAQSVNNLMNHYQEHFNDLDQERKNFQQDIIDKHIEPNRYLGSMDTGQRFDTAIGLILGGLGGGGQGNQALDFLNRQIDRDIASQQSDLNKKETLLSANMRQFGNLKDATDMTKVMMNDQIISKLKMAEAKAQNPLAKARAQQEIGKLETQIAPLVQQLATRRTLDQVNQGGEKVPNSVSPESFVPAVVPEHAQESVFKEIERAQNTRKVSQTALKNFDEVVNQMKGLGGLGRLGVAAYSPAQLEALQAELGSTVGDMEGTVREAAMHNVKNAYMPKATDTPHRLAERREELAKYLQLKSAAPRAKGYGIDLNKFESTNRQMPEATPEPVERITKDGKVALFDPNTKQFLRFK